MMFSNGRLRCRRKILVNPKLTKALVDYDNDLVAALDKVITHLKRFSLVGDRLLENVVAQRKTVFMVTNTIVQDYPGMASDLDEMNSQEARIARTLQEMAETVKSFMDDIREINTGTKGVRVVLRNVGRPDKYKTAC